ncbi:TMEM175 family protein [Streptomyces sp. HUAS 31]|uniref:TMEM175 family protein n=1 Tax=Streptomyces sp. HUAS 31 TaxID=3020055 RepID=UPI0023057388|nr:TMEM175 family protein [Streptomyces sp. HUAS 31]WCE00929.1 TMEM175 family protein [Streptomyces sp. HUAS 31]
MTNRPFGRHSRHVTVGPDRLLALGDAVFSIAMTLLALDITVPDGLPENDVADAVADAVPTMGAYLLSFAVIGTLWLVQHGLFRLIATLDRWLLLLYFALLALIAALPFPTRLISEYGETTTATACYAAAIAVAVTLVCGMYVRLLMNPDSAAPHTSRALLKVEIRHGVLLVLVFATSVPVAFYSPTLAKYWWLLAMGTRLLYRRPAASQD